MHAKQTFHTHHHHRSGPPLGHEHGPSILVGGGAASSPPLLFASSNGGLPSFMAHNAAMVRSPFAHGGGVPPTHPVIQAMQQAQPGLGQSPSAMTTFRNLKVGGLPSDITDQDLVQLFEKFGKIESAKVMLNVQTGESRGYGFVLFDSQEAGCRAFGEMNGKVIQHRDLQFTLDVKNSDWDGRQAAHETSGIYVRNVPFSVTEDELRAVFSKYGNIVSISTRLQPVQQQPSLMFSFGSTPSVSLPGGLGGHSIGSTLNNSSMTVSSIGGASMSTSVITNGSGFFVGGKSTPAFTPAFSNVLGESPPPSSHSPATATTTTEGGATQTVDSTALSTFVSNPTEPLNKLVMIEYDSVESAKAAIQATHRQLYFPTSGNVPVLSKFADPPQLKESKRHSKKPQPSVVATPQSLQGAQQQAMHFTFASAMSATPTPTLMVVPNVAVNAPSMVTVGNNRVMLSNGAAGGNTPNASTMMFANHHQQLPQHQQGNVRTTGSFSAASFPPYMTTTASGNPSSTSDNSSHNAITTAVVPPQVRFPEAVPLPLAPRAGFQKVFYQGTLGLTPDGLLYPIRPEMCYYEPTTAMKQTIPAGGGTSNLRSNQEPTDGQHLQRGGQGGEQHGGSSPQGLALPRHQEGVPTFYVFPSSVNTQQQQQQQQQHHQQQHQTNFGSESNALFPSAALSQMLQLFQQDDDAIET